MRRRDALLAFGATRSDARGISDRELMAGARRSTLGELAAWTQWADKLLVF